MYFLFFEKLFLGEFCLYTSDKKIFIFCILFFWIWEILFLVLFFRTKIIFGKAITHAKNTYIYTIFLRSFFIF